MDYDGETMVSSKFISIGGSSVNTWPRDSSPGESVTCYSELLSVEVSSIPLCLGAVGFYMVQES